MSLYRTELLPPITVIGNDAGSSPARDAMKNWTSIIKHESQKDYFKKIIELVEEDRKSSEVYPSNKDIFNAFKLCPFNEVKVVIVGQDVYHNPGQAHGLSFSVPHGITTPPSLKNIFKEIKDDLGIDPPSHGNLEGWARQGVLLLNAILTVRKNEPASHRHFGWEQFTDQIILHLNEKETSIVFLLWGNFAKSKASLITNERHLVLQGAHPSFYSCKNFFGGKYFSKANEFLIKNNIPPINWKL